MMSCWVVHRQQLLTTFCHSRKRTAGLCRICFIKSPNLFRRALPTWHNYFPRDNFPPPLACRLGFQHTNGERLNDLFLSREWVRTQTSFSHISQNAHPQEPWLCSSCVPGLGCPHSAGEQAGVHLTLGALLLQEEMVVSRVRSKSQEALLLLHYHVYFQYLDVEFIRILWAPFFLSLPRMLDVE